LTNTQFISNTAQGGSGAGGGGLAAGGAVTLQAGQFISNTAVTGNGGGLWSSNTVTATQSLFKVNKTQSGAGGGLYVGGGLNLSRLQFLGNFAQTDGGGLYFAGGNGLVVNTLFARNGIAGNGAGLYIIASGTLDLIHTTVASPTVANGAAIFINSGTAHITNTIIASHTAGIQQTGGTASEDYNLFFGNTADRLGIGAGANSLSGNPAFANLTVDDYKLTASSVAINKGLEVGVSSDFEGETRPQGAAPDIGYDESPFAAQTYIYLPLVLR
jgi:hypothetical protein